MKYGIRKDSGYWSVVHIPSDRVLVDRESYAIADKIQFLCNNPRFMDFSECAEVARSILAWEAES